MTGKAVFSALLGQGESTDGPLLPVGKRLYGELFYSHGKIGGAVFSFDLASGHIKKVHGFQGGMDGAGPDSPLVQVGNALFGATNFGGGAGGGGQGQGAFFKIDLATGVESVVYHFTEVTQGLYPGGYLAFVNGLIYGTTLNGGTNNAGTIYTIDPVSGAHTVVYNFTGGGRDYGSPLYGLLYQGGVFHGTTAAFGLKDKCGTAFSYVP